MTTYAERIDRLLAGPRSFATGISSVVPSVGIGQASTPLEYAQASIPYILWLFLIVFVIMLILTIVHYAVTPIFNFGDNPQALINIAVARDWDKSWENKELTYNNTPSSKSLPSVNYSLVFDTKIKIQKPEISTDNLYVLAYKYAGSDGLTNFDFLSPTIRAPTSENPCLLVVYNALSSKIMVIFFVKSANQTFVKTVSSDIYAERPYRIGVVVSKNLVELYLNGKYAASTTFPGLAIAGSETDLLYSAPPAYSNNVEVRNLFTTNRVVSSGEIRTLGDPALT